MNDYKQSSATIYSLQNYVTQLTVYINQNNAKYTKNLQTLKTFYQAQVKDLQEKCLILQEQNLQNKNSLITLKDIVNNRQKQIKDQKYKNQELKDQNQEVRQKLYSQRKKIDQLYNEIESIKKQFRNDIDYQDKQIKQIQNEKNELILKVKERQQQNGSLRKEVSHLQQQLSSRYSLPQKLKDVQIQSAKNKTLATSLTQTKKELQTKMDYQNNQLERLRKQNKRLEIGYENKAANFKNELNEAINKQKNSSQQKIKKLESKNQKQLFQITELQNSLKQLKRENNELQRKINEFVDQNKLLIQKVGGYDTQKQKYIDQWRKLKYEYEEVIKNLQDAIPQYQKKIFDLGQQNNDLNVQLDGLRDLLNQIKAMNSLQPLKQQYRQIAQLQLMAQKDYKLYKNQQNEKKKGQQFLNLSNNQSDLSDFKDQNDLKWDKLLNDIQNIQVS